MSEQKSAPVPTRRTETHWDSPTALAEFRNGCARKEGTTQAGLDWWLDPEEGNS